MEKYEKYAGWYCIVTKENRDVLSEWRFGKYSYKLGIGYYVGIAKTDCQKGHNPTIGDRKNNEKYFDKQVNMKQLFEATNFKYKKKEQLYEIY